MKTAEKCQMLKQNSGFHSAVSSMKTLGGGSTDILWGRGIVDSKIYGCRSWKNASHCIIVLKMLTRIWDKQEVGKGKCIIQIVLLNLRNMASNTQITSVDSPYVSQILHRLH